MNVRPTPPGIAHGHRHAEAFCLMWYATDDRMLREIIWNSRDGVTPFIVPSIDGREMTHIDWHLDRYAADHQPRPGQRVFIDLPREVAERFAREQVERYWEHPEYPMRERFASREDAIAHLAEYIYGDGHQPHLATVQADGSYR